MNQKNSNNGQMPIYLYVLIAFTEGRKVGKLKVFQLCAAVKISQVIDTNISLVGIKRDMQAQILRGS